MTFKAIIKEIIEKHGLEIILIKENTLLVRAKLKGFFPI
jgi:hypothetical protein